MQLLTEREVSEIQDTLNDKQIEFLNEHLKRGKKSKWLEILSQKKGVTLFEGMTEDEIEEELDSWVLKEVLDGGFGNKPYRCECGTPLRYQYIIFHNTENKLYKLGETCLENYTNLSPEIISDIKKGFHTINVERDEILIKYRNQQFFTLDKFRYIENLPEEFIKQVEIGLPLTYRQIEKLYRIKSEYDKEVQVQKIYSNFNKQQKELYEDLPRWKKEELIEKIIDQEFIEENIPNDFDNKEIEKFVELGFPLLDDHLIKLSDFQSAKRMQKRLINQFENVNVSTVETKMTYQELVHRHLETLKKVREKEKEIPRGLLKDWERIQESVRKLKNNEEMDYDSFKLNLNNLLYALRIKADHYL